MKINANLIRVGNIIKHQGKMFIILNTSIIKPGKGGAFIQVEMRDIISKNKTNDRFRTSDSLEKLATEEISSTFLFADDKNLTFMRDDDFEQLEIEKSILENKFELLNDGMKVTLEYVDGKIINITSIVGHTGNIGQANYSASKAGIVSFSKSLAQEYAKKNININCVSPGFIKTDMTEKINEDFKKNLISKIPSGNLGSGEDVSNCVAFLASDLAKYINGETIHVNGGMYMG